MTHTGLEISAAFAQYVLWPMLPFDMGFETLEIPISTEKNRRTFPPPAGGQHLLRAQLWGLLHARRRASLQAFPSKPERLRAT